MLRSFKYSMLAFLVNASIFCQCLHSCSRPELSFLISCCVHSTVYTLSLSCCEHSCHMLYSMYLEKALEKYCERFKSRLLVYLMNYFLFAVVILSTYHLFRYINFTYAGLFNYSCTVHSGYINQNERTLSLSP